MENKKPADAEVLHVGAFDLQVCVPNYFSDNQIVEFAETECPCGTSNGWVIRREGDKALGGDPERNQCSKKPGCVHVILDA